MKIEKRKCGFGKKPLVLIIIMCLSMAEAAPRPPGHRRRHNRKHDTVGMHFNDVDEQGFKKLEANRLIDQQSETPSLVRHVPLRSGNRKMSENERKYMEAYNMIFHQLKNANSNFVTDSEKFNISKKYRSGNPKWLPKVNFVAIYENTHNRFNRIERKFKYVVPKLYQNLYEYYIIFKRLMNVTVDVGGNMYDERRNLKDFISSNIVNLHNVIGVINDTTTSVNVTIKFNEARMDMSTFKDTADETTAHFHNQIAFRGYENTIKNWKLEFRCWNKHVDTDKPCQKYKKTLNRRKKVKHQPKLRG